MVDEDSEDTWDNNHIDGEAVLDFKHIPHLGSVNRIRAQTSASDLGRSSGPYHVATWSDTGVVYIWDVRPFLHSLDSKENTLPQTHAENPKFTVDSHGSVEGFALDWASSEQEEPSSLRLLTGDVLSNIYLTLSTPAGFYTLPQSFCSHAGSVEDLQWSPIEPTVFASCSTDKSIKIWDVRVKGRKSVLGFEAAHPHDVNVISWNRGFTHLLASGGDDGCIKIWDLRSLHRYVVRETAVRSYVTIHVYSARPSESKTVASLDWHAAPITSVEWHPTDFSILAASGEDDQVTLWDISVEDDDDNIGSGAADNSDVACAAVPSQLLFVHLGQSDVKEVHWHPQFPGMVISTALDSFNIFKTISV